MTKQGPPIVTSPPSASLDPARLLVDSVDKRWRKYRKQLKKCRRDFSERSVHAVRICSRRLIAILDVLRYFAPNAELNRVRRNLKQQLGVLSVLRDAQVQLILLEEMGAAGAAIDRFRVGLIKVERKQNRKTKSRLGRIPLAKLGTDLAKGLRRFLKESSSSLVSGKPLKPLVKAVEATFLEVAQRRRQVAPDPVSIHCLRVAFKKFRYTVEALRPVLTSISEEQLKGMQRIQDRMGEIQDLNVLVDNLQAFAQGLKERRRRTVLPVQRKLQRRLRGRIRTFLRAADQILGLWPVHLLEKQPS